MTSPQTLSEAERRVLAGWAADCVERVLPLFESESPDDARPRDAVDRARAYSGGGLDTAEEIRRRFHAGRAASAVSAPAAVAAARAAGQLAGVPHLAAHALGAAAYAVRAARLAATSSAPAGASAGAGALPDPDAVAAAEVAWQLDRLTPEARAALAALPLVGEPDSGPLGPGLLARGDLAATIRAIQAGVRG
ncbi:putative immunity protein [Schumannella sp. 10F1B-5-1]|uniref:putative immunity protein n=1 Tax=Schumannella sp. 10F1B-5-1 TaxID=2590780 RepID=UPI0011326DB1|nr:hypothetical protein [Schumannella sp. 10F1B-5-1]TPW78380.1 hypothetical protein FJ658_00810 [Schumannella sp. 10F1B-5-1]